MLAHIGGHDGVLGGHAADGLQHLPGSKDLGGLHLRLPLQGKDLLLPGVPVVLGDPLVEQFQHPFGGADDVVVGEDVLVDLRTVDIDLDDLRLAGKGGRVQSHPVREAAAHGDEQVALVTGGVGGLGAVHPHHAGGEGVRTGEAAAPMTVMATGQSSFSANSRNCRSARPRTTPPPHMSSGRWDWAIISTSLSISPGQAPAA